MIGRVECKRCGFRVEVDTIEELALAVNEHRCKRRTLGERLEAAAEWLWGKIMDNIPLVALGVATLSLWFAVMAFDTALKAGTR